jgi:putative alpha-1,2-mannosidase
MLAQFRTGLAALAALSLTTAPLSAQTGVPPIAAQTTSESTYDAADPMIGTGGEGHTFPGAVAPFGMIQLSPDTDTTCQIRKCYSHAAGYRYEDPTIQGFSMTHFSGAGHSDLGDFLIQPVSGDSVGIEPDDYRSPFDHATEQAQPGYYAVTLAKQGVRAEMTAGTRIGVQRYAFPAGKAAHLLLDLRSSLYNYPGKILWDSITPCWPPACWATSTASIAARSGRASAEGFTFHSTFSLWDTFRAEHPLLTLVQPEQRNADIVNSLIASQQASPYGILPVWQFTARRPGP